MKKITKGLDIPIAGQPEPVIDGVFPATQVALLGEEYVGLKPSMLVQEGERVRKGQPLFKDKKIPGVLFTAPAAGVISAIHRGERRVLQSVVIDVDGDAQCQFVQCDDVESLSREQIEQNLLQSGLWTALRTRPFSRVPAPGSQPAAIFVTAIDTNPLAANPRLVIAEQEAAFRAGLTVLTLLTQGKVFLCHDNKGQVKGRLLEPMVNGVEARIFAGVHPAGLVGTHVHQLMPVSLERQIWHIGYQDVIAFGKLFQTGELYTERVIALAGPQVKRPRLVRTQLGADIAGLVNNQLRDPAARVISGSILSGHNANGPHAYLGRFHNQVSALAEGENTSALGWLNVGSGAFSVTRAFSACFGRRESLELTTNSGGGERAMTAFARFESVMPLDILPTLLLRDLLVEDTDEAQQLGALELDEEDLALCSFICPGKYDYGKALRTCLDRIEREG
ncbi:Na(+)-translocating NADH-quinone reductase subunit A [Ferrimonas pelagia]|uniref:Na(+)-translocating NADH-quinone reductase subunit A n=1 Tax=Ferrimonas pelagia TaxID=1177826 RepID=A0ABP9EEV1_9GAMM